MRLRNSLGAIILASCGMVFAPSLALAQSSSSSTSQPSPGQSVTVRRSITVIRQAPADQMANQTATQSTTGVNTTANETMPATTSSGSGHMMNSNSMRSGAVSDVMSRARTDAHVFSRSFKNDLRASTVNMTKRPQYKADANHLSAEVRGMQDAYIDNDNSEARERLSKSLRNFQNLEPFMANAQFSQETMSSWNRLRDDLNSIALAWGQPTLTNGPANASISPAMAMPQTTPVR